MSKTSLFDKIKGGWAGQTIGVCKGGPTEFQYNGTMIQDYIPLQWNDKSIEWYYDNFPGLFDDVYMDVTFVKVFDKLGLDAPVDSFAVAFANADYLLWHANQAARFNILNGIMPPASGHWRNNPHADDIDYQIEADYAGLMSPAMPNAASEVSDMIGHIMNYGDGWYGGVYVAAMYSLAFVSQDINWIVTEALKTIPAESNFYKCINTAIEAHKKYPNDWKQAWLEIERDWSSDLYCPDGVFVPFNIDASVNAAYVVIGLLYGEGNFNRTMEIATRCGQDSDCNPATAAGVLGTMYGYEAIPSIYKQALAPVEQRELAHTGLSLNQVYDMSYQQALQMIIRHKGVVTGNDVIIKYQKPHAVRFEKSFGNLYPNKKEGINKSITDIEEYVFEGVGIVVKGGVEGPHDYVAQIDIFIDGILAESSKMPAAYNIRKHELFWKYDLNPGNHTLSFKWANPVPNAKVHVGDAIWYGTSPLKTQKKNY